MADLRALAESPELRGTLKLAPTSEVCSDLRWFMLRFPLEISDRDRAELEQRRTG